MGGRRGANVRRATDVVLGGPEEASPLARSYGCTCVRSPWLSRRIPASNCSVVRLRLCYCSLFNPNRQPSVPCAVRVARVSLWSHGCYLPYVTPYHTCGKDTYALDKAQKRSVERSSLGSAMVAEAGTGPAAALVVMRHGKV